VSGEWKVAPFFTTHHSPLTIHLFPESALIGL
jgi:hypothetical protein